MTDADINRAVEISPGITWVGVTDEKTPFKCNPYVLDDGEEAVLFEPGSQLYFAGVQDKVKQTVSLNKVRYILLSHQDPDLCASVPLWEEAMGTNSKLLPTAAPPYSFGTTESNPICIWSIRKIGFCRCEAVVC